jgi:hypothetical protein
MWKNIVKTEGPQMTSQYGAYALRAGLARLYARMRMHTTTRPGNHMLCYTCYVIRTLPVLLSYLNILISVKY